MPRSSSVFVGLVAVAAVGAAGWLILEGAGGAGGGSAADVAGHAEVEAGSHGPLLAGREAARPAAPASSLESEFSIPGRVVDERGKPLVGIAVTARRRNEAYAADDPRRWSLDGGLRLEKAFAELGAPAPEEGAPAATVASGADGSFTLVVHRRGDYVVKAEPQAPGVGTEASWYLNDAPPTSPILLRVTGGSALRGRVVDAQDHGVEVIVRVYATVAERDTWRAAPVRTAPGTGAFAFAAVPNGKVYFDVAVPGRLRLTGRAVTAPTSEEVVIRLGEAAALLHGRVHDLQGQGVAGARVSLTLSAVPEAGAGSDVLSVRYFASTDADGTYAIAGPLGGPVTQVEAAAAGYLYGTAAPPLAAWSGLELAPGREASLDLTLWKGGVLDGRVSEKGTGTPLAGVEIQLLPSALDARISRPPDLSAVSDALGHYHVDGVPLGRSILMVRHPTHYLPALESLPRSSQGDMMITFADGTGAATPPPEMIVFVEQEGQRVVKDIELAKGLSVSGRVVDAKGASVEGAEVFARGLGLGNLQWQWGVQNAREAQALATSAADGRFTVPGLPPRKDWALYAKKKPLLGEPCPPFALSPDAAAPEVVLKLIAGCVLAGRVVDERGNGVPGAQINAWSQPSDGAVATNVEGRTDEDGTFRLEGLGAGQAGLNCWGQGHSSGYLQVDSLTAGEVREGLELKVTASVELAGTLVDENGSPARLKPLMAQSLQTGNSEVATSGADGSFKFNGIASGQVRISAGSWENNVELSTVQAPSGSLRLTWKEPPQQVIEGTVVDPQGRSVPVCTVQIRPKSAPSTQGMMVYTMGGDSSTLVVNGWFRRNAHGKAPFSVEVSAPQDAAGKPLNLKGKTVTVEDPRAGPITIALEPGLVVAGRVLDPAGKGVERAGVSIGNVRSSTDAAGAFALGGLGEGDLSLVVAPPAPWVHPGPTHVTAGAGEVLVRLRAGLVIAGELRGAGGKPLVNGWVQASWPEVGSVPAGDANAGVEGAGGRFRLEGIPEEATVALQVQVWSNDGGPQYAPRTLKGIRPGTDDLVIDMSGGVRIEGTVYDASGKVFADGYVMVTTGDEKDENTSYVQIQPDGTFAAVGLEPGPVKLGLYRNDGGPTGETVRVEAPASRVKLSLPPSTPIRGTLTGAGGSGVAWRIWAFTTGENARQARAATVGADGKFSLDGVSGGGSWMVAARARNNDSDLYALAGPFAAGSENIALDLRQGRSLEGTVVTEDGSDVPAGTWVRASGNSWNAAVQAGTKGEFRLRGLPPGRYRLQSNTQDGSKVAAQDDVDDGATGIRLTLHASGG